MPRTRKMDKAGNPLFAKKGSTAKKTNKAVKRAIGRKVAKKK